MANSDNLLLKPLQWIRGRDLEMFGEVGWRSCVGSKQSLKGNFDVSLEEEVGGTGWAQGASAG